MPLRRLRGNGGLGENVQVAHARCGGMKPLCAGCQQKVGPCSTAMHWWFIWIGYFLTWAVLPHILTRNKPPRLDPGVELGCHPVPVRRRNLLFSFRNRSAAFGKSRSASSPRPVVAGIAKTVQAAADRKN